MQINTKQTEGILIDIDRFACQKNCGNTQDPKSCILYTPWICDKCFNKFVRRDPNAN